MGACVCVRVCVLASPWVCIRARRARGVVSGRWSGRAGGRRRARMATPFPSLRIADPGAPSRAPGRSSAARANRALLYSHARARVCTLACLCARVCARGVAAISATTTLPASARVLRAGVLDKRVASRPALSDRSRRGTEPTSRSSVHCAAVAVGGGGSAGIRVQRALPAPLPTWASRRIRDSGNGVHEVNIACRRTCAPRNRSSLLWDLSPRPPAN